MSYPKLTYNSTNLIEFVVFWSNFYSYRHEELYTSRINKKQLSDDDLIKLFEWKNGGKLSRGKDEVVKAIIDKINVVNKLKVKENFSQDIFDEEFSFMQGAIWKIFLLHVINSNKFPIFDQHVYRAYWFLKEEKIKEIPSSNREKENFYKDVYITFFNKLVGRVVLRKKLDEALWAFGKFLKTPYGKKI